MKFQVFGQWKIQGLKFLRAVLNYRRELFQMRCEINAAGRERHAIFHYRVESENPYLSFSMPSAYSKLLLQGITGWVGRALSPQKWETTQTTLWQTVIWESSKLTAGEEWLARSLAGASKYFLVTFNPQSNHNAAFPPAAKQKPPPPAHTCALSSERMRCKQLSRRCEIS